MIEIVEGSVLIVGAFVFIMWLAMELYIRRK